MSENTEIVVSRPTTQRALLTREALKVDTEQRQLLAEYVRGHMVQGTDYGVIPGTENKSLLKPGAEKLVDLFHCTPEFKLVKCEEDFDRGFFNYVFRARLTSRDAGVVLAEGYGSANSREGKYRWRNASRRCPSCGKESIIKGKKEFGGGWLCFGKKGGCGSKWKDGDQVIEVQEQGRVENEDIATLANTILKMAKKRALVDGAIALARCSDMFTQDVEDFMPDVEGVQADEGPPPTEEKRTTQPQPRTNESLKRQLREKSAKTVQPKPSQPSQVWFGPSKGKPVSSLSSSELADTIEFGRAKLQENPKADYAKFLKRNIEALQEEFDSRVVGEIPTDVELAGV